MPEEKEEWDDELLRCPECSSDIQAGHFESIEKGVAVRECWCINCNFSATEQFSHIVTIRED